VKPLLEMVEVTAGYLEDIEILQGVSLQVEQGSVVGLIGLNGAGKSTLIKTIYGFLRPKKGKVLLDGEEITGLPPHRLIERELWFIPQESSLFPYLTVEDNLLVLARRLKINGKALSRSERSHRIEEVLERFPHLKARRRQQAGDLSGGQQKMLEFGKALLAQPRLCLVDEPTVGLAPVVAKEIYGWIETFAESGTTILLIDHNVREVVRLADYIYVLSLGRIAAHGPRGDFESDLHKQVRQWLGINL
jgi:branched-chain amino acid transport system ATP-binding protein